MVDNELSRLHDALAEISRNENFGGAVLNESSENDFLTYQIINSQPNMSFTSKAPRDVLRNICDTQEDRMFMEIYIVLDLYGIDSSLNPIKQGIDTTLEQLRSKVDSLRNTTKWHNDSLGK